MDDAITLREAARQLGSNAPRIRRALSRLGQAALPDGRGRLQITPAQLALLRAELGSGGPAGSLSRVQSQVLAALIRAPLGLVSQRAVARRAGVSATAAGRALGELCGLGLVSREAVLLVAGRVRAGWVWRANPAAPALGELMPALRAIELPQRRPRRPPARRVPAHLAHLFWGGDLRQIELPQHGAFVARRLLESADPEAIAWGRANLPAVAWRQAGRLRGVQAPERALARELAQQVAGAGRGRGG